jgi:methionine salvage enolase-phosphatase E1
MLRIRDHCIQAKDEGRMGGLSGSPLFMPITKREMTTLKKKAKEIALKKMVKEIMRDLRKALDKEGLIEFAKLVAEDSVCEHLKRMQQQYPQGGC